LTVARLYTLPTQPPAGGAKPLRVRAERGWHGSCVASLPGRELSGKCASDGGTMKRVFALVLGLSALLAAPGAAGAANLYFTCWDISGVMLIAPDWNSESATFPNSALLTFSLSEGVAEIRWSDGMSYKGMAGEMNGGLALISAGRDIVETFVLNVGSMELLMTQTRISSPLLPNSVKAVRGRCKHGRGEPR